MRSLEPPDSPSRRRLWLVLLLVAASMGAAIWYLAGREVPPPAATAATPPPSQSRPSGAPITANDPDGTTERGAAAKTAPPAAAGRSTRPAATAPPAKAAASAARELRVTSDIPGAYVFVDRKFLGTTPLVSRDVTPGSHQVNVQVEGRAPVVRTVDVLATGPTVVDVTLPTTAAAAPAAAVDASVAVVHQHGMGSCEGTLRASGEGLRYETTHKDAFSLPLGAIDTLSLDVGEKRLRVKQRGGRTWNFTTRDATAAALATFHHQVDAARR